MREFGSLCERMFTLRAIGAGHSSTPGMREPLVPHKNEPECVERVAQNAARCQPAV